MNWEIAAPVIMAVVLWLATISFYLGKTITKVDTLWAYLCRRAFLEVEEKGLGTMNSPLTIKPEALTYLDPLKPQLQELWNTKGSRLTDLEALLLIEQHFGEKLVPLICKPFGLSNGACLIIALAVAKGKPDLLLSFIHREEA